MNTAAQRRHPCLQRERERGSALCLYAMIATLVHIGAATLRLRTPCCRSPRLRSACVHVPIVAALATLFIARSRGPLPSFQVHKSWQASPLRRAVTAATGSMHRTCGFVLVTGSAAPLLSGLTTCMAPTAIIGMASRACVSSSSWIPPLLVDCPNGKAGSAQSASTRNAPPPCFEDELSLDVQARSAAEKRLTQVDSPRLSAEGPFLGLPLALAHLPSHIPLPLAPLTGPASEQESFTCCPVNSDLSPLTVCDGSSAAVSLASPISPTVALKPSYTFACAGSNRRLGRQRQPQARARRPVRGSTRQCTWRRCAGQMRS